VSELILTIPLHLLNRLPEVVRYRANAVIDNGRRDTGQPRTAKTVTCKRFKIGSHGQ